MEATALAPECGIALWDDASAVARTWRGHLARTAPEAVRDPLGNRIGREVAGVAATAPPNSSFGVIDPFAGSCNGLFSILRHLPGAEGLGFEFEQAIFEMSQRNIGSLAVPIRLMHGDYRTLLGQHLFPAGRRIVSFLAPPWADALNARTGLDLSRTRPPLGEVVSDFERVYPDNAILYVVEVHERLVPEPLAELCAHFDWSELSIFDIAGPTGRHGVLLGTKRWHA